MTIKLTANLNNPPISGLATALLIAETNPVEVNWGNETSLNYPNDKKLLCHSNNDVLRALARVAPKYKLYGETAIERTQIDHWLSFSLTCDDDISWAMDFLDKSIAPVTYLVANKLTIADFALFNEMYSRYDVLSKKGIPTHVQRWYNLILAQPLIQAVITTLPKDAVVSKKKAASKEKESSSSGVLSDRKQEGKFIDLPGAEMGKVIVRFPPEASGYLHIGHAKAALLNQYYQQAFQGKLIMRFDDTNPAKETVEFEKVILEDLEMLQIKPDLFTHTSQYFDLMLEYCEQLMKEGKAYCDDTDPETMKKEREQRTESTNRNNSVDKNFEMWKQMLNGTVEGQKCCVRAKIDMTSDNGCMRDPTIYRCKNEAHPRTGTKYKVYPTYDFACPIVDAIENVTHTLRTMEYHDRDDQFYWFIDALKLRKPYIWEYSRLNMTNTVLSKRKLTWFVDEGLVDGWDDPRFPTVRGILRRGMTVEGLKEFIIAQGSSKSVVFMNWDKIWAINKKVIDPIAPRYTALEIDNHVVVQVEGAKLEALRVPAHPKNSEVGEKTIWVGPEILIDYADAEALEEGHNATFINWGNLFIKKINKVNGKIASVDASLNLDNKDFKKTLKLTWLCKMDKEEYPPTFCVYFDHIISKSLLGRDEDFKQFIGHNTRTEVPMLGDPELKNCKKGDIIQLQRRGFFKVDNAYDLPNVLTGVTAPVVLFSIPDGHTKEMPTAGPKKQGTPEAISKPVVVNGEKITSNDTELYQKITEQGEKVRTIKAAKAEKSTVDAEVKVLLALKSDYKTLTGKDWKPNAAPSTHAPPSTVDSKANASKEDISSKITDQGDKVRKLKTVKADKSAVDAEVKELIQLKNIFKSLTGKDWTPDCTPSTTSNNTITSVTLESAVTVNGSEADILDKIAKQGDKIRQLKSDKADKSTIDGEVKILLGFKNEYKTLTGKDWKPGCTASTSSNNTIASATLQSATTTSGSESDILDKIAKQGDKIRQLKSAKTDKSTIDAEVKILLDFKNEYKSLTGKDWKPGTVASAQAQPHNNEEKKPQEVNVADLLQKISKQGDIVRDLKTSKAEKSKIDTEVKTLLSLKANYKQLTGKDWTPNIIADKAEGVKKLTQKEQKSETAMGTASVDELVKRVNEQGEKVRNLKSANASKEEVAEAVKVLLDLKNEYKTLTGSDFPVGGRAPNKTKTDVKEKTENKKQKSPKPEAVSAKDEAHKDGGSSALKKQTRLGLEATKEDNLPDWYSQVITKGELIEYYDVSGCYILRHWSFAIWKTIKHWFDDEITKLGVKECYFPIFVSKAALEREKTHIADFAPEVAWVTKSGESELAEPIAVRPTSETVMYPAYAKWIQSYRDLPIRLNQWNNVVRWEFKHPQPFLRTREFLWQEGHTAFATKKEADEEVLIILDLYAKVYTDLLAIPVVKGRKTEKEKFAGGDYTTTVEAFISASGRGIQGGTSHHLGQNFSKMFDIVFEDPETQTKQYVYQNSWGLTTRTIGVMIMIHADNQGLVLPPNVACIQVIIVPCGITASMKDVEKSDLLKYVKDIESSLKKLNVRVEGDYRDNYSPGWKFNHWELKGVPIRLEIGPKDMKAKQVVAVRRDTGEKSTIPLSDTIKKIPDLLETIHKSMYAKAENDLKSHTKQTKSWTEFCKFLDSKNLILAPFCGNTPCEEKIKADSARDEEAEVGAPAMGAKTLCIPFDQPTPILPTDKCVYPDCKENPKYYVLFGRSY